MRSLRYLWPPAKVEAAPVDAAVCSAAEVGIAAASHFVVAVPVAELAVVVTALEQTADADAATFYPAPLERCLLE